MIRKMIQIDENLCNGCGGLEYAAAMAIKNSEKNIPMQVTVISIDGKIKEVR